MDTSVLDYEVYYLLVAGVSTNLTNGYLLRGTAMHAPGGHLEAWEDAGVVISAGKITEIGEFSAVRKAYPQLEVRDHRPGLIIPGFVDTHVHFPQLRILGGMGKHLLDWLTKYAFPEEIRMREPGYAQDVAQQFIAALIRNGTTAAVVFGAHFAQAQEELFKAALAHGFTLHSGLVWADRNVPPELIKSPSDSFRESEALIRDFHGQGGIRYTLTPRFALSVSEESLDAMQALLQAYPEIGVQTHLNEDPEEIAQVAQAFPWAQDYLAVYQKAGLVRPGAIFAHNVYPSDRELLVLAETQAGVAHCPSSNAHLGSGLFPMLRHRRAGVQVGLGSDVGAGASFSILAETRAAYQAQRLLRAEGYLLTAGELLYMATGAGAKLMGIPAGELKVGWRSDLAVLEPVTGSTLAELLVHTDSPEEALARWITMGGEAEIKATYLQGELVYRKIPID